MQGRVYGNEYSATVVCIDAYHRGELSGRFYNPYLPQGMEFASLLEFFRKMEDLLDQRNFPQSFTVTRSFGRPPPRVEKPPNLAAREGRRGTFLLRILFRQNASWQGNLVWTDAKLESSFRSALELILLLDSALARSRERRKKPPTDTTA